MWDREQRKKYVKCAPLTPSDARKEMEGYWNVGGVGLAQRSLALLRANEWVGLLLFAHRGPRLRSLVGLVCDMSIDASQREGKINRAYIGFGDLRWVAINRIGRPIARRFDQTLLHRQQ